MLVSKQKFPVRKRRFVHNMMKRDVDSIYIQYYDCFDKFFDENGNKTRKILPPTTVSTQVVTMETSKSNSITNTPETSARPSIQTETTWLIGGISVGVLFFFMFVICCLVFSRRTEKKKRKKREAEYRVLATTLTSITDTEDGTMYAQCMTQPTYGTELQLPSRKQRNRLGGVSNGIQTMKRWFSVEGDQASHGANASNPHAGRQLPLPAIPEGGAKSNSFPRSALGKTLSVREGIYDEIGPDVLRRSHIYNPLDVQRPAASGVYDGLRTNTLPSRGGSRRSENGATDNYFLLEPTINEATRNENQNTDNYFIVEKEQICDTTNRVVGNGSETESVTIATNDVSAPKESGCSDESSTEVVQTDKNTDGANEQSQLVQKDRPQDDDENKRSDNQNSKEDNNNESADASNYFILEKEENDQSVDDYLEPMEKQRNSYIDILPEQESFMKVKEKYHNET